MSDTSFTIERRGGVAILTMARGAGNALDLAGVERLHEALAGLEQVVIRSDHFLIRPNHDLL